MEQRIMDKEYFVKKVLEDRHEAKKQKISKQKRLDSEYLSYVSERKTKRIKRQRKHKISIFHLLSTHIE